LVLLAAMIEHVQGNLLNADVEALVNTVNTVGVMGKGVALQFKLAFPKNFSAYEAACRRGEVKIGRMFVFRTNTLQNPRFVINFPTKKHWRGKSRLEYVEAGLRSLIEVIRSERIHSVAVPPLGCGSGGLDWEQVKSRIEAAFAELPNVGVFLYAPQGAPDPDEMKIATTRPSMTPGRAAMIALMARYALPGYRVTMLEVQKLAYFLQCAGEVLKLDFQKQRYGPYAETLHHVLQRIEGHFISGYGDRSRSASIAIHAEAAEEAEEFLKNRTATLERLQRVSELIEGFETPYGMELLSSVHWVGTHEYGEARMDPELATRQVLDWNEHKRKSFRPDHIRIAWERLKEKSWL
jgi:O-acetyl-ADP-ribose deacetylase (regulator of RNase III)